METNAMDLTNLVKSEKEVNMLPQELIAANLFNKKNTIGSIETQLPVSNMIVTCNPMGSLDEITVKTITGSIQMYVDANIEVFFSCMRFPEDSWVKNLNDFKQLPEADYMAAVYGVMKASFKTLNNSSFRCKNENCTNPDENNVFKFTPTMNMIQIEYPQGIFDSPNKDFRKDTFVSELGNITITYKFDSIGERIDIFKNKSNEEIRNNIQKIRALVSKIETIPLFVDSITITDESLDKPIVLSTKSEIMIFIHRLNTSSKEIIEASNDKYIDHILGYQPKFSAKIECPHCKQINDWEDIDLMVEFFLKISAIY